MAREEFVWEPSSWPFFFTPPFFISLVVGLVCTWILTPLFGGVIVPKSRTFKEKDKSLFNTLAASTLHALVTVSLSSYIMIQGLMGSNRVFSRPPLGFTTMQIMLGYFVGDFIVVLLDPHLRKDAGSIAHHMAGIIGIGLELSHQGLCMFFIVSRMISEGSTPFVNAFHMLRMTNNKETKWFLFLSVGMIITFFVFRIIVMPWYWYELVSLFLFHPDFPKLIPWYFRLWLIINYLAFDVLNIYWFIKMMRGAYKHFKSRSKMP